MHKILAINLGATSTKIAYFEGETCLASDSIVCDPAAIKVCAQLSDQIPLRRKTIAEWMDAHGVDLASLDAVVSRGGLTQPVPGGVIEINQQMIDQALSGEYGVHPCGIGTQIAFDLAQQHHLLACVVDTPVTDELTDVARFSGLAEVQRTPKCQALNARAVAKAIAHKLDRALEDINVIVATMGGGTSVIACQRGRLVDTNEGVLGEGPFSTNRCGGVSLGPIVKMCYSGERTYEEMVHHLNGEAGFIAYVGTPDVREIEARIDQGDAYAAKVLDAYCYQVAKEIGAMACVLEGAVDAIALSGGIAYCDFVVEHITRRVQFIAPVDVYPGGDEMTALWQGAFEVLEGKTPLQTFQPISER